MTQDARASSLDSAVAVIGLAGRFPGARDPVELWQNLVTGQVSVRRFSIEDLRAAGVAESEYGADHYVPARGVIDDIEFFDADLFGVPAREAEVMDPQHRMLLTCAWEALEDAGYPPRATPGRVAVFAGCSPNTYAARVYASPGVLDRLGLLSVMVANEKDHLATRIAYRLRLTGPAVTVATGCSTSLTATHLAVQSLLFGDCDMALAGGACITVPQHSGYLYTPSGILSPDGHTRTFDASARGTVPGNGVGLVVLKRAADAIADGDAILALIRGSAINNDGAERVGYSAPSVSGQAAVIRAAHQRAGWEPHLTGYFEAHGTGTEIGDKIEVAALGSALGDADHDPIALGSVKPNIGHLDAAAGIAGLIKVILSLRHGVIAPSVDCAEPDPKLDLDSLGLFIPMRAQPWPSGAAPRRAAISSFGLGGTNAHVVLESAPPVVATPERSRPAIVVLSARTPTALLRARDRLAQRLHAEPKENLADVSFTLQTGREQFANRLAAVGHDAAELHLALRDEQPRQARSRPLVVFAFPGQGPQHAGMARGLYRRFERARTVINECAELLAKPLNLDIRQLLLEDNAENEALIARTELAQPALFVTCLAVAEQLREWGVRPALMLGHSIGEYVAACVAGGIDTTHALTLVVERGRVMSAAPPGGMIGVRAGAADVAELLGPDATVAAVNGPKSVAIAGPSDQLDIWLEKLAAKGIGAQRLNVSGAFHSPLMDPILGEFGGVLSDITFQPLQAAMLSNADGAYLAPGTVLTAGHWQQHMRQAVQFQASVERLLTLPSPLVVEVGPGRSLSAIMRQVASASGQAHVLTTMATLGTEPDQAQTTLARTLAKLWTCGVTIDWRRCGGGRRVSLPTYSFEPRRLWLDPPSEGPVTTQHQPSPSTNEGRQTVDKQEPGRPQAGEAAIVEIWADLLSQHSGPDTDFFEMGGESLLALRVTDRIQKIFGVTLSVTDLWDNPTPRGLALRVATLADSSAGDTRSP